MSVPRPEFTWLGCGPWCVHTATTAGGGSPCRLLLAPGEGWPLPAARLRWARLVPGPAAAGGGGGGALVDARLVVPATGRVLPPGGDLLLVPASGAEVLLPPGFEPPLGGPRPGQLAGATAETVGGWVDALQRVAGGGGQLTAARPDRCGDTEAALVGFEAQTRARIAAECQGVVVARAALLLLGHSGERVGGPEWRDLAARCVAAALAAPGPSAAGGRPFGTGRPSRLTRHAAWLRLRSQSVSATLGELEGHRGAGRPAAHLPPPPPSGAVLRRGEALQLEEDVSAVVRVLALEVALFLERAARPAFDLEGWLYHPPGLPPVTVQPPAAATAAASRHERRLALLAEEARHRGAIQQAAADVHRVWDTLHTAAWALVDRAAHAARLGAAEGGPAEVLCLEQCCLEKAIRWAELCWVQVRLLLDLVLAPGCQLGDAAAWRRPALRSWFAALSAWCAPPP